MADPSPLSPASFPTRTVAIIKPHALSHRLDIERRITESGFEIAKERQMMFRENDRDVEDLFGVNNAISLAEGPCWVYVLERRRAVEVLKTLMGDEDPDTARRSNANSLRALYGTSIHDNALIGSPDNTTAEHQISILFASSPPFRATDLPYSPSLVGNTGSLRSITSSILSALNRENGDEGFVASTSHSPISGKATSTTGRSSRDRSSSSFRARPVPATNGAPSIKPRLSRAAELRAGLVQPIVSIWHEGPREAISKEEHERTFANVPGHKRTESIAVASTAPPAVAPRMTRAASLRQGIKDASPIKPRVRNVEAEKKTFEGVPGHRRRETLQVASVQPPTVAPRINRTAALRAEKDKPPPSSYMFRAPSAPKAPSVTSSNTDSTTSRRLSLSRSSSSSLIAPSSTSRRPSTAHGPGTRPASATLSRAPSAVPPPTSPPKRSMSAVPADPPASVRKPTIEPRQNRSALLRAKKLESTRDGSGKINGRPVFV
ncbi:hypothetical protein JB92DRAFT_2705493 [Gautieria morchelliformis]|nr:hypothetical protein JB92DRAFT_2705493 [Gautieria morchelliformis]